MCVYVEAFVDLDGGGRASMCVGKAPADPLEELYVEAFAVPPKVGNEGPRDCVCGRHYFL